jgi:hypothetical protein
MKGMLLLISFFFLFNVNILAQGYVMEWESDNREQYDNEYFGTDATLTNDRLDMEGDGVLEIVAENNYVERIRIYDGSSHLLEWEYDKSQLGETSEFVGFFDIDGDGEKEAVFDVYEFYPGFQIKIVNPQTSSVETTLVYTKLGTVLDIDNDGYPELLVTYEDGVSMYLRIWGGGGTGIGSDPGSAIVPRGFNLSQNYPNPFNPSTDIKYSVSENDKVSLKIYNTRGQLVRTLVNEKKTPGEYVVRWNGRNDADRNLASGTYFYQITVGDYSSTKKAVVLK